MNATLDRTNVGTLHTGQDLLVDSGVGLNDELGRLMLGLFGNRLESSVVGFDSPGVLAFLTKVYLDFNVNIESCFGEKLKLTQGSYFELTAESDQLNELGRALFLKSRDFRRKEVRAPHRVYELDAHMSEDRMGLLYRLSSVLSNYDVNLTYFRADKLSASVPPDMLVGDPEAWKVVDIFARLELPKGVNASQLHQDLFASSPTDLMSEVVMREVRLRNGNLVPYGTPLVASNVDREKLAQWVTQKDKPLDRNQAVG